MRPPSGQRDAPAFVIVSRASVFYGDKAVGSTRRSRRKEPEERKHQFAIWYAFVAFLGVMLIQYVWLVFSQVETIPYSQFEQLLSENKISEVTVGADSIQGTLKSRFLTVGRLFYTVRVDPGSPTC